MTNNIYGIQKIKETELMSGLDMATHASTMAATGAQIGSKFGPITAGVGLALGTGVGLIQASDTRERQREQREQDVIYNRAVEDLEGRTAKSQRAQIAQAKNGLRNRYQLDVVEMEGGTPAEGGGEIHTDKNYNIIKNAKGGNTHEKGGVKTKMNQDDIIWPTQNKEDYDRVLNKINRYKLNGDKSAKAWLDNKQKQLPTDSDYGYAPKAQKGMVNENKNFKALLRKLKRENPDSINLTVEQINNMDNKIAENFVSANLQEQPTSVIPKSEQVQINKDGIIETPDGTQYKKSIGGTFRKLRKGGKIWTKAPEEEVQTVLKSQAENPEQKNVYDEIYDYKDHQNPLSYANVAYNLKEGAKSPDKSTRYNYVPGKYEYTPRTEAEMRQIAEAQSSALGNLRGRGMSAGQSQAYLGQISAQTARQRASVYDREAERADNANMINFQTREGAKEFNIGQADRYNIEDLQNAAATNRFTQAGISELAKRTDLGAQRKYMQDVDTRATKIQKEALPLVGTSKFGVLENDPFNIGYTANSDNYTAKQISPDVTYTRKPFISVSDFNAQNDAYLKNQTNLRIKRNRYNYLNPTKPE